MKWEFLLTLTLTNMIQNRSINIRIPALTHPLSSFFSSPYFEFNATVAFVGRKRQRSIDP